MAYTVGAVSLGCNKNRVDTETALGLLKEKGFLLTDDPAKADILLVNTCGFIDPAKEESVNTILEMAQYKISGRCKVLVVTGCLSQRYSGDLMEEIPEIDVLLGVNQYAELPAAINKALGAERPCLCSDDYGYYEHDRVLTTPSYSAYIRIGEGCSNRCTFCAIPMIRGPYRSRNEEAILREIRSLACSGVREHILVAQDTTRYGTEMPCWTCSRMWIMSVPIWIFLFSISTLKCSNVCTVGVQGKISFAVSAARGKEVSPCGPP